MDDLAIIIVTWNSAGYIGGCLRSVQETGGRLRVQVCVVDNASDDGTAEIVRAGFSDVTLLENPGNVGFAAANNQALRRVRARYVMLLNPDTILRPGAVEALVGFMDRRSSCYASGPAMLNADGTPQRTGMRFPGTWNLLVEALFLDRLAPRTKLFGAHRELYRDPSRARQVDYLQGACLVLRSSALEVVGLLDEGYFMYFEETDLCFRLRRKGGEVWYCPDTAVVHFGGGEFGHFDEQRLVHYHRSLLRFYAKHYNPLSRLAVRPVLMVRSVLRALVWAIVYLVNSPARSRALSAVKGYVRCLGILVRPVNA